MTQRKTAADEVFFGVDGMERHGKWMRWDYDGMEDISDLDCRKVCAQRSFGSFILAVQMDLLSTNFMFCMA